MWYALIDIHCDTNAATWLVYGTLQDISEEVLKQCRNCDPDGNDVLDFEALDEEAFYYDEDDYLALSESEVVVPELLHGFRFCLSDAEVSVHCLAEGYAAFRQAFAQYDGRNRCLAEISLPAFVPPEEEEAFAEELADILFTEECFDELAPDRKYITRADEE